MRKRNNRMRLVRPNAAYLENAIANSQPPSADEVAKVMNVLRIAYENLKAGHGTADDVHQLGWMLNVGFVRAQDIGQPLAQAFDDAGKAMQECESLQERHGRYGFTGPGILLMNAAMDLYADVLGMSSPNQMEAAENKAEKWLRESANQRRAQQAA